MHPEEMTHEDWEADDMRQREDDNELTEAWEVLQWNEQKQQQLPQ